MEEGSKNQIISMRKMKELAKMPQPGKDTTGVCDRRLNASAGPGDGSGVDHLFPWSWQELKGKKGSYQESWPEEMKSERMAF